MSIESAVLKLIIAVLLLFGLAACTLNRPVRRKSPSLEQQWQRWHEHEINDDCAYSESFVREDCLQRMSSMGSE